MSKQKSQAKVVDPDPSVKAKQRAQVLEQLTVLSPAPRLLSDFQSIKDADLHALIHAVDESGYALGDWLQALQEFYRWEENENRLLSLRHKIDYLHCCVEGAGTSTRLLPLQDVWAEYIKIYGVE